MSNFSLHPQLSRDCFFIRDLELCRLLLMNDKNYPWCILVPKRENVQDIYQLQAEDQVQLVRESSSLSFALMSLFTGKKMNVAALGNMVPQLHVHHIVRFEGDPCWPKPVWGQLPAQPYEEAAARKQITRILTALS